MSIVQIFSVQRIFVKQKTFDTLIGLLGEGSAAGRAVAVAQATIKGIEGVQNAYTTAQSSPIAAIPGLGQVYPLFQAGLAAAFSAKQIQSILQTPAPPGFTTTAPGQAAPAFGPTVATPAIATQATSGQQTVSMLSQMMDQTQEPVVLLTPTSGPGSFDATTRANDRRNNRQRFGG